MRAIGIDWEIAERELVRALRDGFTPRELPLDGEFDRLVVADFEMEEGVVLDAAPVTAVERILADEIERARDIAVRALGEDEHHALGHACSEQAEALPGQIGRAPFARTRIHVEGKEGVEMRLGDVATRQPFDGNAALECLAAFPLDGLPLARGKRREEFVEGR